MGKTLEQMSLGELGRLFPIYLTEYRPEWKALYHEEKARIEAVLDPAERVGIHHYGSTAVPGIQAKPTIDILLEVRVGIDKESLIARLKGIGYQYCPQPANPPPHMMFMKGYSENGYKGQAFHLHVRYPGDWDELYFCDYLRLHPEIAKEYEALKLTLKERHEFDREAYTRGKTEFIKAVTEKARNELGITSRP